jgi:hypothetical protein
MVLKHVICIVGQRVLRVYVSPTLQFECLCIINPIFRDINDVICDCTYINGVREHMMQSGCMSTVPVNRFMDIINPAICRRLPCLGAQIYETRPYVDGFRESVHGCVCVCVEA